MTGRFLTSWVLLLALVQTSVGQTKVIVVQGASKNDVVGSFGLVPNSQGAAANNRLKLQTNLDAGAPIYPWFWRGSATNLAPIHFNDTLVIPADAGRIWTGSGFQTHGGVMAKYGSYLCLRAVSFATTFDGVTNKLTSAGAGAVVAVTGRAVTSRDQYNSVRIDGGTGVTAGWYGILSVTEGDSGVGTWTLDRSWCTGVVTNGTGYYCPTFIRNHGMGTYHRGLLFAGRQLGVDTPDGSIGYHVATADISSNTPTGKHTFESCTFSYFDTAILCGKSLAEAYPTSFPGDWDGYDGNNADTLRIDHSRFENCNTCVFARTQQSVGHVYTDIEVVNLAGQVFYFDAGGKLTASGIQIQGKAVGSTQCLLRLGPKVAAGDNPFIITGFGFDGGPSTRNPQLIVTDWVGLDRQAMVVLDGGIINRASTHDSKYLVDVQSRCLLTVRNVSNGSATAIWAGSVRLRNGATSTYKPRVVFEGCVLDITTNPEEIIDEPNTDAGATVDFIRCIKLSDGTMIPDKRYTTL